MNRLLTDLILLSIRVCEDLPSCRRKGPNRHPADYGPFDTKDISRMEA